MALTLDFTGKHAFVFGGTTGIGFGVAENFSKHGANVSVASRKQENVDAAVAALGAIGGNIVGAAADVRDFDAVVRAFDSAAGQLGTIDVLVSGAAGNFVAAVNAQSSNGFRVVVDIDLIGTFNVMRAGYPHLTKPGAAVINISAPQSFIPMRYQASACAAKAGVDQLTRVLALEWGDDGIRVNSISPGPIAGTEGMRRLASPGEAGRRRESALAVEDNAAGVAPASHNQGRERRPHYPGDVTDDLPARRPLRGDRRPARARSGLRGCCRRQFRGALGPADSRAGRSEVAERFGSKPKAPAREPAGETRDNSSLVVSLVSLGAAISSDNAGIAGLIVSWGGIAAVNVPHALSRRRSG
jgi:NAD(P)-dependent dehydrogenase (short-subunit alcohol dehydrogenase family)